MKYAFEVKNVHKYYGKVVALAGVSLKAEEGKIFGMLGPNGAGKTTIVKVLSTLITPDKGWAKVHGIDVVANPNGVRANIGLAGQFAAVDEFLTGRENIVMVGQLYGLTKIVAKERATDILEKLGLTDAADRPVKTYSGGMRRRLDLGASLVGEPKILFLDEPTTGLDPRTRKELWEIIRQLKQDGTSILLTTQYLEEADELADKIAVIDNGKMIAEGTSAQLKRRLGGDLVEIEFHTKAEYEKALDVISKTNKTKLQTDEIDFSIKIPVSNSAKDLLAITQIIDKSKLNPTNISLHKPSLDDVFLSLTGKKSQSEIKKKTKAKRQS